MYQILRKKFLAFILCAAVLLALCGCQHQKNYPFSDFPLDSESIASLEATYGKSLGEIGKEWGFSINDLVEKPIGAGAWFLDKTTTIAGKDFSQTLLIDMDSDMCTGFEYRYYCDSEEELTELADTIFSDIEKQYGAPAYDTVWGRIGEISWLSGNLDISEENDLFCIRLTYRVLPEEWHRFVPEYEAPFALFPLDE